MSNKFSMSNKTLFIMMTLIILVATPVLASDGKYIVREGDTLSKIAREQGVKLVELIEQNPQIEDPDQIYVGDKIELDKDTKGNKSTTAQSAESSHTAAAFSPNDREVSAEEKDLLARIIHAEAKGESYTGKLEVGHVVLNRVDDDEFPDTIAGVIHHPGQFQPVTNGAIYEEAGEESVRAAEEVLASWGNNDGALYFYNPHTSTDTWIFSRETIKEIGNHVFAR
jgi:N-acetylmuramoyl-L-alanine amidase